MLRILPLVLLFAGSIAAEETPTFQEPQGALTLQQAMAAALLHAPDLAVYPWDLRIADARLVQAGLRPNPELSIEVENVRLDAADGAEAATRTLGLGADGPVVGIERERESGSSAFGNIDLTLSLSQLIELGGKRAARIVAAEKEREVTSWDFEVARFEVVGEVLVRFAELLAAQERLRHEQALVHLVEQLSAKVGELVDAGRSSPLEARRAKAEAELARIRKQDLVRAIDLARLRLAATWGSPRPEFSEAVGDVSATRSLPPLQAILDRRAAYPMLKRWGAELAQRESLLAVERKQRVPDLTLRLGYRGTATDAPGSRTFSAGTDGISASRTSLRPEGWEHGLVMEASIPLPLFHRNQGAIQEAELRVERLGDEQRAWEQSLEASITEQHATASAALERLEHLNAGVLPELESTLALTREGYERGKFDFLRVLDAQRAVVDVRLETLDAQLAYHLALADMERLAGAAIDAEPGTSPSENHSPEPSQESSHE